MNADNNQIEYDGEIIEEIIEEPEEEVEAEDVEDLEDGEEDENSFVTIDSVMKDDRLDRIATYNIQPVIIKDENRKTLPRLNDYEFANVISKRIMNIQTTGKALCSFDNLTDPKLIALKELQEQKCPLQLRRGVGYKIDDNKKIIYKFYELWDVNNMIYPKVFNNLY